METAPVPQELWGQELEKTVNSAPDWIWDGFVARANLTLLTSQWKAGKTTLVSLLLARRVSGGTLAGYPVKPGVTVVVTEEDPSLWAGRVRRHHFGAKVCFFARPFKGIPSPQEWNALLERIRTLQQEHGVDLLVLDPLAPFLRCENNAQTVLDALLPLRALTAGGMGVLVLHHPAKGEHKIGQAARGSGAMLGHADIIVEMRHPAGNPHTRRRRFLGLSRHQETPPMLLLELDALGNEYFPAEETAADDFPAKWEIVRMVLEDAKQKLTRRDILLEWPEDFEKPDPATLYRWLTRAVKEQKVLSEGTGRKTDPYRYWLAEREEVWKKDILYQLIAQQPFQPLHSRPCDKRHDDVPVFEEEDE